MRAKRGRSNWAFAGRPRAPRLHAAGTPIAIITTAGNVPDIKAAQDLVEAVPPVAGRVGRPRRRPDAILADGGCDSAAFRDWLRSKRIEPIIPQRGRKKIIGLGTVRWVVEQAIAHLHQFRACPSACIAVGGRDLETLGWGDER